MSKRKRAQKLLKRLEQTEDELANLRRECKHPNLVKSESHTNYEVGGCNTSFEVYYDNHCPDCLSDWTTTKTVRVG